VQKRFHRAGGLSQIFTDLGMMMFHFYKSKNLFIFIIRVYLCSSVSYVDKSNLMVITICDFVIILLQAACQRLAG